MLRNQLNLGDWQTYIHEWLECDGQVVAVRLRTPDCRLELTMHQVNNDALRSLEVRFPTLKTGFVVILAVRFKSGNKRFYLDPVQVFMQTVQQYC